MNDKELIQKEIARIGKSRLVKSYAALGKSENTLKTALVRGSVSKGLAFDLETLTQVSALFWMWPNVYQTNGEKRI